MAQLHFVVRFWLIFSAHWALLKPLTVKNVAYCEDLTVHGLTSAIIDKRDGHYDMKTWGPWMPMFLMSSEVGTMDAHFPYKFIGFGDMGCPFSL